MPNSNGHGPKRAILYARVSTDEQARSGYSLAQQLEALRAYTAREGYEVLEEVSDPGQSGASLERPGMDRVRDLVAGGGVYVVLAQDRDRFAREPAYHYLLRREFEEHDTKIRALNDRGDDSPEGDLTDGILDQLAKYERAKAAERTRRGKLKKAKEGKIVAAQSRPTYGFRFNEARDGYMVDEATMRTVHRVFSMVGEEQMSLHGIKRTLEADGIPAPNGGRFWNTNTIRDIVLEDCYRPHSYGEVEEFVSPQVAATLNQSKSYGICWYNRRRVKTRQVGEDKPEGRRYRRVQQTASGGPERNGRGCLFRTPGSRAAWSTERGGLYSTIVHLREVHTFLSCQAACSSVGFADAGWHPTAGVGVLKAHTSATTAAIRAISADAKPVRWERACVPT